MGLRIWNLEYPAKTIAKPQVTGNFLSCPNRDSNPGRWGWVWDIKKGEIILGLPL